MAEQWTLLSTKFKLSTVLIHGATDATEDYYGPVTSVRKFPEVYPLEIEYDSMDFEFPVEPLSNSCQKGGRENGTGWDWN